MIYLSECDIVSKIFQSYMCTLSRKPISDDGETVIYEHVMDAFMYVLDLVPRFRTIVWQSVKYGTNGKISEFFFQKNEWNKKKKNYISYDIFDIFEMFKIVDIIQLEPNSVGRKHIFVQKIKDKVLNLTGNKI